MEKNRTRCYYRNRKDSRQAVTMDTYRKIRQAATTDTTGRQAVTIETKRKDRLLPWIHARKHYNKYKRQIDRLLP